MLDIQVAEAEPWRQLPSPEERKAAGETVQKEKYLKSFP